MNNAVLLVQEIFRSLDSGRYEDNYNFHTFLDSDPDHDDYYDHYH